MRGSGSRRMGREACGGDAAGSRIALTAGRSAAQGLDADRFGRRPEVLVERGQWKAAALRDLQISGVVGRQLELLRQTDRRLPGSVGGIEVENDGEVSQECHQPN